MHWDGSYKYYTKNCDRCNFYRKIDDKELYGWGVAFKYLARNNQSRKCEFKDKDINDYHSIKYLDEIIGNQL